MKRQEQAEDKNPSDMDWVQEEQSSMEEMEHTRLVQRDSQTVEKQVSKEGMEQQDRPVGGIRESRIGPGINSKIMELKRVGVGGSGEKRKRVRKNKEVPELPSYFPRIDTIISAMGGSKHKRKRKEDVLDDEGTKRKHMNF